MSGNLDDILNDALNDFDFEDTTKSAIGNAPASASTEAAKAPKEDSKKEAPATSNPIPQAPGEPSDDEQQRWADEFMSKLDTQDPDMKKLMESFASAFGAGAAPADGPSSSSSSSVPLPNLPEMDFNSPEMAARIADLQKMLADVENGDDSEDALDKILEATGMSKMMEQLMSKDVLLEPFQEMDSQYIEWFKENDAKTSAEELDRFKNQHKVVKRIIQAYTESTDEEGREVVAGLLSDMQALGDPPQGLLQTMLPDIKFDAEGKPILPM